MEILCIVILLFLICRTLYLHYEPSIEVIVLDKKYQVYLWYNIWVGSSYEGRIYTLLFEI